MHVCALPHVWLVMFGHDRSIGQCMLVVSAVVVLYYLVWVVGLPFMDEDSSLRSLFPRPILAIIVPTLILVFLLTVTGVYIIKALVDASRLEKSKVKLS